ncbi:269_t:CDS:2, partial [Acaulospora colombiana]
MSSDSIPRNFNINNLKLTPEKLAEWSKRCTSNTLPFAHAVRQEPFEPPRSSSFTLKNHVGGSEEKSSDIANFGLIRKEQKIHWDLRDDDKRKNPRKNTKAINDECSFSEPQSSDSPPESSPDVDPLSKFENMDIDVNLRDASTVAAENAPNNNRNNDGNLFGNISTEEKPSEKSEYSLGKDTVTIDQDIVMDESYDKPSVAASILKPKKSTYEGISPHPRSEREPRTQENGKPFQEIDRILDELESFMKSIQESQFHVDQELDYLERLEPFEDELRRTHGEICDLKYDFAKQISIDAIEKVEECVYVFEK